MATSEAFQQPHRQLVCQQLRALGTYLLLEDTTELLWPEAAPRRAPAGWWWPTGARTSTNTCARAQPSRGTLALSLRGRPGWAREVALHLSWSPPLAD